MLDPDLVDEYLSEYRLQSPAEPISQYEGNFICFCFSLCGNESIVIKRSKFKSTDFGFSFQSLFQLNESELMTFSFDHGTTLIDTHHCFGGK